MQIRSLSIPGAFELTPAQHRDDRGVFLEWYRFEELEELVGHRLDLRQANLSISRRGVVRGIHFADLPPGQAKYVTVVRGSGIDFVVDLRVGSPTFGQWDSVRLDDTDRRAVYIAEGLGHAFVALEDDTTLSYMVSTVYSPGRERDLNVLDPDIALVFPEELGDPVLSPKDHTAPTLAELRAAGALPSWDDAKRFASAQLAAEAVA